MSKERPDAAGTPRGAVPRTQRYVEAAGSAFVVGSALLGVVLYLVAMASTSLWTDELYGIVHFSGRGPWTALTDYHVPNNHILFSLLNALLPWSGSVDPFRARLLSLVAVPTLLVLVLVAFWRRGRWVAGAVAFQLLAGNDRLLDQTLQARGYGLQLLFAGGVCVALRSYLESASRRSLAVLAALVVLGTFTVPPFLLFGGGVFALVLAFRRRREVLVAGIAAFAGSVIVYLPVLGRLLRQLGSYRTVGGGAPEFGSLGGVVESLRLYVLPELFGAPRPAIAAAVLLGAVVLGAAVVGRVDTLERDWIRIVVGAVLLFYGGCLVLRNPLVRTTVFVAAPLALAAGALLEDGLRALRSRGLRAALVAVASVGLTASNVRAAARFDFVPIENWQATADLLREVVPPDAALFVTFRPELLAPYVRSGTRFATRFDAERFARGEVAVVDTDVHQPVRFDGRRYAAGAVEWRIPQRLRDCQVVWFVPRGGLPPGAVPPS
jgi:hypothetical protein